MALDPGSTQEVGVDYTTLDLVAQLFALQGEHLDAISDYIGQHCMLTGDLGVPLRLLQPSYVDGRDNAIEGFAQGREISAACQSLIADTIADYTATDALSQGTSATLGERLGITITPQEAVRGTAVLQRGEPGVGSRDEGGNAFVDGYGVVSDKRVYTDAAASLLQQQGFRVFTDSSAPPTLLERANLGYGSGTAIDWMVDRTMQGVHGTSETFHRNQAADYASSFTRAQDWAENRFGSRGGTPPDTSGSPVGDGSPDTPSGSDSSPPPVPDSTGAPETPATRTTLGPESVWLDADQSRVVNGTIGGLNAAWGLTDSIVGAVEAGQSRDAANAQLDAMRSLADRPANTDSIAWARGGSGW